jgi:Fe2+ or Zn2+ uptake regulation protein
MATRRAAAAKADRAGEMLDRVKASGLKLTPQRMAIVREIASDPTHPTAQEIFERLRQALPTMSFATVYNTLDALTSAGLCAALALAPGASRFDPNMDAHHHAVCDRCGLVRDIALVSAGAASSSLRAKTMGDASAPILTAAPGFQVRSVERIYRGLCAACASKTKPVNDRRRIDSSARKKTSGSGSA